VALADQASAAGDTTAEQKKPLTQFFGFPSYRSGPFALGGSGYYSGIEDLMALRNLQGGVNGVMYEWEECETAFETPRGVECYERFKARNVLVPLLSTGMAYALTEQATKENIVLFTAGHGRSDSTNGTVFPFVFNAPCNYWSQTTSKLRFIAERMGGMDKLKGLKIAYLYFDTDSGREIRPALEALAQKFGVVLKSYALPWPATDQKAQWMDIVLKFKADWVLSLNWGLSCTVPLKEAARLNFPMDRIIGYWFCGGEHDVLPAGKSAKGYIAANFHGVGKDYPIIEHIIDKVYGAGKGNVPIDRVGSVYYNRGVFAGIVIDEAIRTAQKKFGVKTLNGKEIQWGLEHLDITPERIKEIGAEGLIMPLKITCKDHEGGGNIKFQQWDGEKWVSISGAIPAMKDLVWERVQESSGKYAKEKGITPRNCSEE